MRLQIEIQRHTLPPVNILYNTSSSQPAVKTISELLSALDKIVPLESEDGEWGLEDYVVEVAATSDQTNFYECLHYQLAKDVLQEDDEVIIRGLTTDEIRERRRGGRLQILPDGRHLFDGVAWGRRYNVHAPRPGISIPPRKRRRLLAADEDEVDDDDDNNVLQIGTLIDDEEGADDEEYEDVTEDDHSSEQIEDDPEQHPLRIVARHEFDDADVEDPSETTLEVGRDEMSEVETSEEEEEEDDDDDDDEEETDELDEDEVQLLLKEAGEIEEAYNALPLEFRVTNPLKKRKRGNDDIQSDTRRVTFEGFSSQNKEITASIGRESVDGVVHGVIGDYLVVEPNLLVEATPLDTAEHSIPESLNMNGGPNDIGVDLLQIPTNTQRVDSNTSGSTSSSDVSDSNSDADSESSDDSSDYESDASSDDSSSDSESDSESDQTTSSDESESESETGSPIDSDAKQVLSNGVSNTSQDVSEPTTIQKVDNPPGTGTKRTRSNNSRAKLRKRLAHLKAEGILPPEANFDALRVYEAEKEQDDQHSLEPEHQQGIEPQQEAPGTAPSLTDELTEKKEELLARLNNIYESDVRSTDAAPGRSEENRDSDQGDGKTAQTDTASFMIDGQNESGNSVGIAKTPLKRARLDVESSRRMLFNSLGLRNPKTPAAEQALREKLSKPVRNILPQQIEQDQASQVTALHDHSWKNKLIISAIECVQEGLLLSPPPFPFKQRWERDVRKKKARESSQYYQHDDDDDDIVRPSTVQAAHVQEAKSAEDAQSIQPNTTDPDEIPYPNDIPSLPSLSKQNICTGAIIAYRELQLGPKFEPEESSYQVARITTVGPDLIDVVLFHRDRIDPSATNVDPETGERIYSKFEMPVDENHAGDDGTREITFEDMISPKLVRAADVQVSNSDLSRKDPESTQDQGETAIIPESFPQQDASEDYEAEQFEVDTPRRNEISNMIKDAGFNPGVDEKLLQPIDMPKTHRAANLSIIQSRPQSDRKAVPRPGEKSSRLNIWRSSPLEPDAENTTSQLKDSEQTQGSGGSPPEVSMVETVDYPHVSQMDINQSSLIDPAASSSHQDAQRISPAMFDNEDNSLSHLRVRQQRFDNEDSQASSLPSEVPQSQPANIFTQAQTESSHAQSSSVKIRGGDGATDMLDQALLDSDYELDSDGFPSIRALTSSQSNRRKKERNTKHQVSPPPLRKRVGRSRNDQSFHESESPEPTPEIKISASQKPSMTLSQIPPDTNVVDLTLSSDSVEPPEEEGSDWENVSKRVRRIGTGTSRRASGKTTTTSQKDTAIGKRAARGALSALGGRRNLSGIGVGKSRGRG